MLGLMDSHDNCNYEKYLCTALEGKLGFPFGQISINLSHMELCLFFLQGEIGHNSSNIDNEYLLHIFG